jgi:hypothetical protein
MPKRSKRGNQTGTISQQRMEPERFSEDITRGRRERHTQKTFIPKAMSFSLAIRNRWKAVASRPKVKVGGRARSRSPSTRLMNKTNVKRKPAARGRR